MAPRKKDSHRKVKRIKSPISAHYKGMSTTDWANFVAMLAAENKAAKPKSKKK